MTSRTNPEQVGEEGSKGRTGFEWRRTTHYNRQRIGGKVGHIFL